MRLFKINKTLSAVCDCVSTRSGFKHVATLLYNGREIDTAKARYQNRTWERYKYETVLKDLSDSKELDEKEQKQFKKAVKKFN